MKTSIKTAVVAGFVLAAPMAQAGKETVPTPGPTVSVSTASTAASAASMSAVMSSVASMAAASAPAASIPSIGGGTSTSGRPTIGVQAAGTTNSASGPDGGAGSGGGSGADGNQRAENEGGAGNDAPRRQQGTVRVTVADLELILPRPVLESPQVASLVRHVQSGKPVSPRIIGLLKAYSE